MNKRTALLCLPLILSGCFETETQCLDRLTKDLSSSQVLAGVGLKLGLILTNDDLDVCDYTVLGNQVIEVD